MDQNWINIISVKIKGKNYLLSALKISLPTILGPDSSWKAIGKKYKKAWGGR